LLAQIAQYTIWPMRHILITLLLTASTAHAETWLQLGKVDQNGGAIFIDTSSIDRDSQLRKARFKYVFTADRPIGSGYSDVPPNVQSYRWELKLGHFNCADWTAANSLSTLYSADNQPVGNISVDPSALKFRMPAPKTAGGLVLQAVCGPPISAEQPTPGPANMTSGANPVEFYPPESKRRAEQGTPIVKACVGASGELLRDPEVVMSSGFSELDAAAIKVAKASRYKAGTEKGVPLSESCIKFKVKFVIKE
jgi:TonB family protein